MYGENMRKIIVDEQQEKKEEGDKVNSFIKTCKSNR